MATETIAFTKQDQLARIAEVTRDPKHVRLNVKRLEEVAKRAPASMATNWIDAYRTADEHYRAAPPIQLSDLDQIQFAFVFGTQGWLIWEWTREKRATPLDLVIDGTHYIGSFSMFAFHYREIRRRADGYLFRPDSKGLIQLMQTYFPSSWRDWPMAKLPNVNSARPLRSAS